MQRQYRWNTELEVDSLIRKKKQYANKSRLDNKLNQFKSSIGACYEVWRNNDGINYDNFSILVCRFRISKSSKTLW